jgi:energy-coupling factor transporter ATP-binding protein EcfA2
MSCITNLKLKNFTAFESLELAPSPGINVLIGVNGAGKTHILKVLYAACAITEGEGRDLPFSVKLRNVFSPYKGAIGRLVRRRQGSSEARIEVIRSNGARLYVAFSNHAKGVEHVRLSGRLAWSSKPLSSAFIPVKEMLALAPGFIAVSAKREWSIEEIYVDIIKKAYLPLLTGPAAHDRKALLGALENAIEGKVILKGETFFLKNKQGELEFPLLAEGMRKLALIWLLIQNGSLTKGSILFWDEPEANLNPSLMEQVVKVIFKLQELGVQVFLTTHNYVLLKQFDLQASKKSAIQYISLFREPVAGRPTGPVVAKVSDTYSGIDPNDISGTLDRLYDEEVKRSFGGGVK